jgi:hypothetical protein
MEKVARTADKSARKQSGHAAVHLAEETGRTPAEYLASYPWFVA